MLEDLALMRVLPNMVVVVPCDSVEAKKATLGIADNGKPSYIRLARNKSAVVTTESSPFAIGKANVLIDPDYADVAVIACGQMVYYSLLAARQLEIEGIKVSVTNLHTIKPIDTETIHRVAANSGAVVTVEEHQVAGGLGSAVAEVLATTFPVPMEFLGVQDKYGQSGEPGELLEHYGLGVKDIVGAVKKVMGRKR